jgi:hypothetical protein
LYKSNKYFHITKNNTAYHALVHANLTAAPAAHALSLSLSRAHAVKLLSTTEQMPALVNLKDLTD